MGGGAGQWAAADPGSNKRLKAGIVAKSGSGRVRIGRGPRSRAGSSIGGGSRFG